MSEHMELTSENQTDPRDWSIDDVVQQLCHNPTPIWSTPNNPQLIPEREMLDVTLRQNHVDGDTLLALDMPTLKDEMGVSSFGQKRAIMRAIEYLRRISHSYQQMVFQADSIARMQSTAYNTPQITNSRPSFAPQSPAIAGLGILPPSSGHPVHSPSMNAGSDPFRFPLLQQQIMPSVETSLVNTRVIAHHPTPSAASRRSAVVPTTEPLNGTFEPLDMLQASVDAELYENNHRAKDPGAPALEDKIDHNSTRKPRKKIAPMLIEQLPQPSRNDVYLSVDAKLPQDTFYHKVVTDWDDQLYCMPHDDVREFSIGTTEQPPGQRRVIAAQIKHFLRQTVQRLPRSRSLARIPYRQRQSQSSFERLFTIFPAGGGRPSVRRMADFPMLHDADRSGPKRKISGESHQRVPPEAKLPSPTGSPQLNASENMSDLGEFRYLLDKYPVAEEDEFLPPYGDSGDEGELDEETWREYVEERNERQAQPASLTRTEVERIIDETLEQYRQEWHESKLLKVQLKAYRLWMHSAKQKSRSGTLKQLQSWRDHSLQQLHKLKEAVLKDTWHKPADIKHQCQNMEITTSTIEEHKHLIQALLSDGPPPRPQRPLRQLRPVTRHHSLEDGEELLESDSDPKDNWDDFLDDSSDKGSIHHEPDTDEGDPVVPKQEVMTSPASKFYDVMPAFSHTGADQQQDATPATAADAAGNDADVETDSDDVVAAPSSRRKNFTNRIVSPIRSASHLPIMSGKAFTIPPDPDADLQMTDSDSGSSNPDRSTRLPASRYRSEGRTKVSAIDLTMSSPPSAPAPDDRDTSSDYNVHTPDLNPDLYGTPPRKLSRESNASVRLPSWSSSSQDMRHKSSLPSIEDIKGMQQIDWSFIEDQALGPAALAKAVYSLDKSAAVNLTKYIARKNDDEDRRDLLFNGLGALRDDSVEGSELETLRNSVLLALLYLVYNNGKNYLDGAGPSHKEVDDAFQDMDAGYRSFFTKVSRFLRLAAEHNEQKMTAQSTKKRKRVYTPEDLLLIDDSDLHMTDDLDEAAPPSSHKKRKRVVVQDQEAMLQQASDQKRIEDQEKRRKMIEKRFSQIKSNGAVSCPVINSTLPVVKLDPHIAVRVKDHQLRGIQFMWREIIEDPKHQGCILAHTMGLGKTMQVISLLVTIAQCNQSDDEQIRQNIPRHLRTGKIMILCPASLLDNWSDELIMWSPDRHILGSVYKLDTSDAKAVVQWSQNGGILLLSYERFRLMIAKSAKAKVANLRQRFDLEKILLQEPSLVIADEAHKMKNPKSTITQATKRFKTLSRIALTGSPLNNHLEEYHTMVDWIAPRYLGSIVQFRAKYSEPIKEGLYADSSHYEKRLSLRKLHVLKRDLAPKIDRADISAIEKDMPSKTEYFITIPLTDQQKQGYNIYIEHMAQMVKKGRGGLNARIWSWLAVLQLLCNHPSLCVEKLKERQAKLQGNQVESVDDAVTETEPQSDAAESPEELLPADVEIDPRGPMYEAMQKVIEVFDPNQEAHTLRNVELSYRTSLVHDILAGAMAIGDKTLIFSHSIPSLNYLERMLKKMNCSYVRLDGETKISNRQRLTKDFNSDSSSQAFLISMRAGGLGMNLQGANRVIIFDFSFNPSWEEQAIGRAYRLGQTRPVFVYRFRAGCTFEETLFNTTVFKTQMFQRVVDQKNPARHASKNISEWLFPAGDPDQLEFDGCVGKDPDVLDKIIKRVDYIRNIELTETFQREDDEKLNDDEVKAAEQEYLDERLQRDDPAAWEARQRALIPQRAERFPGYPPSTSRISTDQRVPPAPMSAQYIPPVVSSRPAWIPQPMPPSLGSFTPYPMHAAPAYQGFGMWRPNGAVDNITQLFQAPDVTHQTDRRQSDNEQS